MDLTFQPDGDVAGYKTDFMKELFPELKADTDVVMVFNPIPDTSIAVCSDNDGHICSLCKKMSNKFAEFNMGPMQRMCLECGTNIFRLLQIV